MNSDYTKAIEALELASKKAEDAIKVFKNGLDKAEEQANELLEGFDSRWENRNDHPKPCEVRSIHQEPTKIYINGEEVELDVPIKRGTVDLNTLTYIPKDGDEE